MHRGANKTKTCIGQGTKARAPEVVKVSVISACILLIQPVFTMGIFEKVPQTKGCHLWGPRFDP